MHFDAGLVVGRGREHFALARRDRGVALDQRRHDAAHRLDAERQRRHVEQQQVLDFAGEHAGLDRRADRDDFVRVHALVRFLAEQLLDDRLHARDARRAADQHDFVDLRRVDAGVGQRLLGRADRLLQQVFDQRLELRARQLHRQVLRAARVGGDERQVDLRLHHRRQLHLGLLRRLAQPLQRHAVLAEVDAVALAELVDDPLDDALIEVVAAQVRVAVGRLHFDHALADFEDRDVERAAAEVVDGDGLVLLLVEAVGQRRGGRLVDDAHHFEAGDLPGFLGGLALRVVEVGRAR